jgi:hypothetical protein
MGKRKDFDFELDLSFKENKNPSEALNQLAKMYDKLLVFDKHLLYNIFPESNLEYQLVDIEFGSIKTRAIQILNSIPDDFLKEILNPSAWIGLLLVTVKHKVLNAIECNEIKDADSLKKFTFDTNKIISKGIPEGIMYLELNNFYILNTIQEISALSSKLNNDELYIFKSKEKTARINNKAFVDMPKILKELGSQTFEQQRIEILKVKTIELLSNNAKWSLIREGKQIDVKISHKKWLDDYHSRKIIIQPNDFLKVDLKIIHTTNQNSKKPIISYEAIEVLDVIPPDDSNNNIQIGLF